MRASSSRVRSVAVPLTCHPTRSRADTIIHQTFNHQKVPLALRLSGQLLLGVVRIYTRKLDFLQRDSAEALVKFRQVRCGVGTTLRACRFWLQPALVWGRAHDRSVHHPTGVPAGCWCGPAGGRADGAAGEHRAAGQGL